MLFSASSAVGLDLSLTGTFSFAVVPPDALTPGRALTVWVQFRPVIAGPAHAELRGAGVTIVLRGVGIPTGLGAVAAPPPKTQVPPTVRFMAHPVAPLPAPTPAPRAAARGAPIPALAAAKVPTVFSYPKALTASDNLVWISLYSPQDTESATATVSGISGVAIGSVIPATPPGIFALASTCPAHPAEASTCTITATASPGANITEYERINIDSPDGSTLLTMTFASAKAYVEYSAMPSTVDFGGVSVGETSSREIDIADIGGWPAGLTIQSSEPGELSATGCHPWIRSGAHCALTVAFTPTALGPFAGSLTLGSLDTPDRLAIPISGTGLPAVPALSVASLSFAGTPGETQSVALSNPTSNVVSILGVTASQSFAPSTACTSLAPGQSCQIAVQYLPNTAMNGLAQSGQLSIFTGKPAAISQVALNVAANRASLAIDRSAIQFGPQQVGTVGLGEPITITNTGQAAATVGIQSAGDFVATNDCATLAPGASCTATLSFAPSASHERSGLAIITGGGAIQTVGLAGEGVVPAPKPDRNIPLSMASGALGGIALNLPVGLPELFGGRVAETQDDAGIEVAPASVKINCAIPGRDEAFPLAVRNASARARNLTFIVAGPFAVSGCADLPAHGSCVAGVSYHGGAGTGVTNGVLIVTDGKSSQPIAVVQLEASVAALPDIRQDK